MSTDASLLQRYMAGDESAFTALVARYLDAVYSWALRRVGGDAHLAQDVAQQVFIGLARNAQPLSTRSILTGWLYIATRNAAANEVRRERRRKTHEQEAKIMDGILSEGSAEIDWSAVAPVLEATIDRLSETARMAILLRFSDRRTFSEIGAILQMNEDAARKQVERAVAKLHSLLVRRGITTSSAALGLALANHAVIAAPPAWAGTVAGASVAYAVAHPPALGLLTFMSTTKTIAASAAVVLVLAIGTSSYEAARRRQTRTALERTTREQEALLAQRREFEQRAQSVGADTAMLRRQIDDERATQEATRTRQAAQAQAAAAAADPVEQGNRFMARHPEVKQALVEWTTARVHLRYRPLYQELGLTRGQIAAFETLLLENWGRFGPPLDADGQVLSLVAGRGLNGNEVVQGLRDLLGEDGLRKYFAFENTGAARSFTAQIASGLCFTDAPLTSGQADELTSIMVANQVAKNASKPRFDWDAITAKARDILAPAQLAALSGMRAEDEFQQAFNGFRASSSAGAKSGGNVAPK